MFQAQKVKEKQEKDTIPEENEEENSSSSSLSSKSDEGERDSSEEEQPLKTPSSVAQESAVQPVTVKNTCVSPTSTKHSDSEKENNSPTFTRAVEASRVGVSEESSETCSEDGDIDDMNLPTFFLRRHSLPVSSHYTTTPSSLHHSNAIMPSSYPNDRRGMFPAGFQSGARRHSLPTARIVPMTSFEKLSEKLSTLKEASPTDGRMAFDFVRWGNSVPRISLSSNVLMNVNMEATRQTDAHGLNQAMLSHQRKFQSEPQIKGKPRCVPKSGSMVVGHNNSNNATSLSKLQNASGARVNTTNNATSSRSTGTSAAPVMNSIHHNNNNNSNNNTYHNTFHSNTVLPSISCSGLRRHSYTSTSTSASPQRTIQQHVTSVLASSLKGHKNAGLLPRRASMDDKYRYDTETQPLLHCQGEFNTYRVIFCPYSIEMATNFL